MRSLLSAFVAAGALAASLSGCKWTDFDDLADTTWVHSQEKPDIGANDYAVAILGVAPTGTATTGQLAVVSRDAPNLSTLAFDPSGSTSVSGEQQLGQHFINSLGEVPIIVGDGMGKIALVEKAIDSPNIAVVIGAPDSPGDSPFLATSMTPDSATFAGQLLVVGVADTLVLVDGVNPARTCAAQDMSSTAIAGAAALAADGTNLYVWTKTTGEVLTYPLATLDATCQTMDQWTGTPAVPPPVVATASPFATTGLAPGSGALFQLMPGTTYAVLAAHGDRATAGQVFAVDLATGNQVSGSPLSVDGVLGAAVGTFGADTYVALGFPNRSVDGVKSAGQVELHKLDVTGATPTLDAAATLLNDAQPKANQFFGRSVTTMQFNGNTILVVAASNEVFAYYQTALYPDAR